MPTERSRVPSSQGDHSHSSEGILDFLITTTIDPVTNSMFNLVHDALRPGGVFIFTAETDDYDALSAALENVGFQEVAAYRGTHFRFGIDGGSSLPISAHVGFRASPGERGAVESP